MALSDELVLTQPVENAAARRRGRRWRAAGYLAMLLAVLVIGLPVYWTLIAAFKTSAEIYGPPT